MKRAASLPDSTLSLSRCALLMNFSRSEILVRHVNCCVFQPQLFLIIKSADISRSISGWRNELEELADHLVNSCAPFRRRFDCGSRVVHNHFRRCSATFYRGRCAVYLASFCISTDYCLLRGRKNKPCRFHLCPKNARQ